MSRSQWVLLVEGWQGVLGGIEEFREEQALGRQPVIFTEMGYTQRAKSTLRPWAHAGVSLIYDPTTLPDGTPGEPEEYVVVWADQPSASRSAPGRCGRCGRRTGSSSSPF